jgi:hypothetical protein
MRQVSVTKDIYTFDELSETIKKKLVDDHKLWKGWWDPCYEIIDSIAKVLGIDIDRDKDKPAIYFDHLMGGGTAIFDGSYYHKNDSVRVIKKRYPKFRAIHDIAVELQDIQKKYNYALEATIIVTGTGHSMCIETYNSDYGSYVDEKKLEYCFRDFCNWMYYMIKTEYEKLNSAEAIIKSLRENEYLEDGTIYKGK